MNEKDYLQWFAENLQLVASFFRGHLEFYCAFHERWHIGYAYIEDYDGIYHLDALRGKSSDLSDALRESYECTLPLVEKMRTIRQRFDNPERYTKGISYTYISLATNGRLSAFPIVSMGHEKAHGTERAKFKNPRTGRVLLFLPYESRMIFPAQAGDE